MKTFLPTDPFTNGELKAIADLVTEAYNNAHGDPGKVIRKLESAKDRLKAILPEEPTPRMKAQYPLFVEDFSRMHARSALLSFVQECQIRGIKVKPNMQKVLAMVVVAGLRMGMIMSAKLREKGIDPLEMLVSHGISQAKVDKHAAELRAVEKYSEDFEAFVEGFVDIAADGDWKGNVGGIVDPAVES